MAGGIVGVDEHLLGLRKQKLLVPVVSQKQRLAAVADKDISVMGVFTLVGIDGLRRTGRATGLA